MRTVVEKSPDTLQQVILNEDINNYVQTDQMTITWERERECEKSMTTTDADNNR